MLSKIRERLSWLSHCLDEGYKDHTSFKLYSGRSTAQVVWKIEGELRVPLELGGLTRDQRIGQGTLHTGGTCAAVSASLGAGPKRPR